MPALTAPRAYSRPLRSETTLGSFSGSAWLIELNQPYVPQMADLDASARVTLSHEFGHLLHSFTTYAGLVDLRFWAEAINAIAAPVAPGLTLEAHVTAQAKEILSVARRKQLLAIDDFYYLEENALLMPEALNRKGTGWMWGETTGGLFRTDGTLSDRRFWALRFYLDEKKDERSFIRIPVGLRTILEHMATGADFIAEFSLSGANGGLELLKKQIDSAHNPNLLHYYALTHRLSSALGRMYTPTERRYTFVAAAQVVAVLADIPFDDPVIWKTLVAYAEQQKVDSAIHMAHPHPSFVFPLLVHAFEQLSLPLAELSDPTRFEFTADGLLKAMGLPSCSELRSRARELAREVETQLTQSAQGGPERGHILSWIRNYEQGLTVAEKLLTPTKHLGNAIPVPVLFSDDGYWEGAEFSMNDCQRLVGYERRYLEMLRYPAYRDIVTP